MSRRPPRFIACAAVAFVTGCANLPTAAYLANPREVDQVHAAWVRAGQPDCTPVPPLYVYEAPARERADWCDRVPAPDACLAHARTSPMRTVWLAVVSPEYPAGWRHEALHMLEAECLGGHDYDHSGPQWDSGARHDAGVP